MLEIRYVWEWPVRLTHWVNVLCIVVLSLTGFYIGHPFITAPETADYVMGWSRFIHFIFAYLFTVSVVSRLLWATIGNQRMRLEGLLPLGVCAKDGETCGRCSSSTPSSARRFPATLRATTPWRPWPIPAS